MTHVAQVRQAPQITPPSLLIELAASPAAIEEAQALRYRVFAEEYGARLATPVPGLDMDEFDPWCEHLLVRDSRTGDVVATTRMLDSEGAKRAGGFYSEGEFHLVGLAQLRGPLLEIGRTCVHPDYRNGATISTLWSGLAQLMRERNYNYLMGCASIPMGEDGIQAHAVMQRLRKRYLNREWLNAVPRRPLADIPVPENLITQIPPLLKAYMRLGASLCGEPCWDPAFNVADVFILLDRQQLCPRYARHFRVGS